MVIADQLKLSELAIQRDDLYSELIDMAELINMAVIDQHDIDEIEAINHEIDELDNQMLALNTKYVPSLIKLI